MSDWMKENQTETNKTTQMGRESYHMIRVALEQIPGVHLWKGKNGSFRYPIHLTESLATTSIEVLDLGVRSYNCLKRAGIHTIGELCTRIQSTEGLKTIRNCGKTSAAEIMDNLFGYQYELLVDKGKAEEYLVEVILLNRT